MYSTRELATLLGVSTATLVAWRAAGDKGPEWIRLGSKLVRYRIEAVEKWLAEEENENV